MTQSLKVALAQLNPKVGDVAGNLAKVRAARAEASKQGADLVLTAGDNSRRFFEASWVHKYKETYYFSYSTGDTHFIMYATGKSPYGPFTVRGKILEPVLGWTNHHSIIEYQG